MDCDKVQVDICGGGAGARGKCPISTPGNGAGVGRCSTADAQCIFVHYQPSVCVPDRFTSVT